jgi:transposase-like protein
MVFYYTVAEENVTLTAKHFSISRKTFHKWFRRFKDSKYAPIISESLADQSNNPKGRVPRALPVGE